MHSLLIEKKTRIKKAIPLIESKIKIKILFRNGKLFIKGDELNEFVVLKIIRAIDLGFDPNDALLLTDPNFIFEIINIKEHTRRRNLQEVRKRVIGTKGKAKRTIEELTGASIVINDNTVGIIVGTEHSEAAIQAIISLIQGAKHANVFSYLEKFNAQLKKTDLEDLGLRDFKAK
ncbi:MAG: hypothetical protein ACOYT4_00255 [Nanoarchaeota archaeon]